MIPVNLLYLLYLLGKQEQGAASDMAAFSLALARVAYADNVVTDGERVEIRLIAAEFGIRHPATTQ